MALQGLLYRPPNSQHGDLGFEARRNGIPTFDGSADTFDEWKFRVETKYESLSAFETDERNRKKMELVDKIVESLRGVAFQAVVDAGLTELMTPLGPPRIIEILDHLVRPVRK